MVDNNTDPKNKVTISDIATACGVSPATVSLVLNNKAGVGRKTRQKVLDAAQAMGYITKPSPISPMTLSTKTIGLVIRAKPNDILGDNRFYAPVLAGIESICRQYQMNLMYATMLVDDDNHPLELPRILSEGVADGLLLVGVHLDARTHALLQQQNIPVVLVDAYAPQASYDAVLSDNMSGSFQATNLLIEKGHQKIAIVGSQPDAYPSICERRAGYDQALAQAGLSPIYWDCSLLPEDATAVAMDLLDADGEVTAVFGCNDAVAIAVMQVAQKMGKCVPEDIAIVGFDNILSAQHVSPALTTMRIDKQGMGRLAAQQIINRLEYPESGQVNIILRPSLINRDSA